MSRDISNAIFDGDIEKFDLLVHKDNVGINAVSEKEKWNFLHTALVSLYLKPNPRMIKHLIERGVDYDARDCYGNTPLHYAARCKNKEVIELLLNAGAEIDPVNLKGVTPLRETLISKPLDLSATEVFLSHGADFYHKPDSGVSILDYVEMISHGEDMALMELFKKYM